MQAIYFMAGNLVAVGVTMQAFDQGEGWLSAIIAGIVLCVGTAVAEYNR